MSGMSRPYRWRFENTSMSNFGCHFTQRSMGEECQHSTTIITVMHAPMNSITVSRSTTLPPFLQATSSSAILSSCAALFEWWSSRRIAFERTCGWLMEGLWPMRGDTKAYCSSNNSEGAFERLTVGVAFEDDGEGATSTSICFFLEEKRSSSSSKASSNASAAWNERFLFTVATLVNTRKASTTSFAYLKSLN